MLYYPQQYPGKTCYLPKDIQICYAHAAFYNDKFQQGINFHAYTGCGQGLTVTAAGCGNYYCQNSGQGQPGRQILLHLPDDARIKKKK